MTIANISMQETLDSIREWCNSDHPPAPDYDDLVKYWDTPKRWDIIRQHYRFELPNIMERGDSNAWSYPYFTDWVRVFTPIEDAAWHSIRSYTLPMYPQFPVDKFFLDFGNPVKCIGLEMDGAEWHNAVDDRNRDNQLMEMGWKIFRVPGNEAMRRDLFDETDDDETVKARWILNTGSGVIFALNVVYGAIEVSEYLTEACIESLDKHSLIDYGQLMGRQCNV